MDIKIKLAKRKTSKPLQYFHFKSMEQFQNAKKFIRELQNVLKTYESFNKNYMVVELSSNKKLNIFEDMYILKQYNGFIDVLTPKEFKKYYNIVNK